MNILIHLPRSYSGWYKTIPYDGCCKIQKCIHKSGKDLCKDEYGVWDVEGNVPKCEDPNIGEY